MQDSDEWEFIHGHVTSTPYTFIVYKSKTLYVLLKIINHYCIAFDFNFFLNTSILRVLRKQYRSPICQNK